MAKYEITLIVDIDEIALALHDGDEAPPPNDVNEWYDSDIFLAHEKGWVDTSGDLLEFVKRVG